MFGAISLHWSLKLRNSLHAYAEVRLLQEVFTVSPIPLWPIWVQETHVISELYLYYCSTVEIGS